MDQLPAHIAYCLYLAPAWYVPMIVTLHAATGAAYLCIGMAAMLHAQRREIPIARIVVRAVGVFVLSCGAFHLSHIGVILAGGWWYWAELAIASAMTVVSLSAMGIIIRFYASAAAVGKWFDDEYHRSRGRGT